jgi:hypothetical protein
VGVSIWLVVVRTRRGCFCHLYHLFHIGGGGFCWIWFLRRRPAADAEPVLFVELFWCFVVFCRLRSGDGEGDGGAAAVSWGFGLAGSGVDLLRR